MAFIVKQTKKIWDFLEFILLILLFSDFSKPLDGNTVRLLEQ